MYYTLDNLSGVWYGKCITKERGYKHMARTKNYGFCRNEAISLRLSWKDKEHLEDVRKRYKMSKSEVIRMMINSYYLYFAGCKEGYIEGGVVNADQ